MDAEFATEWERNAIEFLQTPVPAEIRDRAANTVADVLAATVAGAETPGIREVSASESFADGGASVLGTARRTHPTQAALLNTAAAIAQEIEEGHNTVGHVGASIVAGSVGVAEQAGVDGRTFVDACARVYELCIRLERAIFAMKEKMNEALPWLVRDPHSTWTTVGPAMTSALCLGADRQTLREVFRIAANLAVVSMHDPYAEGPPARNFTAGFSAQAGVTAALSGTAGLTGSESAIHVVYDPFEELLEEGFTAQFRTLGENWEITEQYLKPYPSCRYTHPPVDALRDAVDGKAVDPDVVEAITVETFTNAAEMSHASPETMTGAKFSTPYVLARYLTDGELTLGQFERDAVVDTTVQTLADRVSLSTSPEYERAFPESWGARVRVTLRDGTVLSGERSYPRGDHRDPLSETDLEERNRALLAYGLPESQVEDGLSVLTSVATQPVRTTVAQLTS